MRPHRDLLPVRTPTRIAMTSAALAVCLAWGPPRLEAARPVASTPVAPAVVGLSSDDAKTEAVKVGFLYNFTKLVEWPERAFEGDRDAFHVVVLGHDGDDEEPLGAILEKTFGKKRVGSRPVVVRRVEELEDVGRAHIVYVGRSFAKNARATAAYLARHPTLVVSSIEDFARDGGMLAFAVEDNKLKFSINLEVAEKSGLVLSSKLLSLARIVETR